MDYSQGMDSPEGMGNPQVMDNSQVMDHLKLFRISTLSYFVNRFVLAERTSDRLRNQIWATLENNTAIQTINERVGLMSTRERLRAIGRFVDFMKTFDPATKRISQTDWMIKVDKCFEDTFGSDFLEYEETEYPALVFDLVPIKLSNGDGQTYYVTALKGCSLISLDQVCVCARILTDTDKHKEMKREAYRKYRVWQIYYPGRGITLFLHHQHAAELCRVHVPDSAALAIVEHLQHEQSDILDGGNGDDNNDLSIHQERQRQLKLHLLDAVDTSTYIITFFGSAIATPSGTGHLVLLRDLDAYVHVASFMRSCFGLPLRANRDLGGDGACVHLTNLTLGPGKLQLTQGQINALTLPAARPAVATEGYEFA